MEPEKLSFLSILQWDDVQCRIFLSSMRWPDGPQCPKCGAEDPYTINRRSRTKNKVNTFFKCRSCRRQFTVTVGTIFEDSKIPLKKWLAALYLMVSSKKGISAHQLYRMLDFGSYRTAWFMAHRIREAMREKGLLEPLSGDVEADETYIYPKRRRGSKLMHERIQDEIGMGIRPAQKRKGPYEGKTVVFGMQERNGKTRTRHVPDAYQGTLQPVIMESVDAPNTRLITDGSPSYRSMKKHVHRHESINHELEYVRGDVHTQNIDNAWSVFKRGIYGVFHHISEDYLPCYLSEFDFRRNWRKVTDVERFLALMSRLQGRVLWYCRTPQPENPFA